MKKWIFRGLAVLGASLVVSCVSPSTPAARIASNPGAFDRLSSHQQELVRQGVLERGMRPEAVWLAWGEPARRFEGWEKGKATLRWDYAGTQPVYATSIGGSVGWYGGRHWGGPFQHRYGYAPYTSFEMSPEVAFVPYHRATAWFANGKLEAWSRAR
jgi:hypothetical protein